MTDTLKLQNRIHILVCSFQAINGGYHKSCSLCDVEIIPILLSVCTQILQHMYKLLERILQSSRM